MSVKAVRDEVRHGFQADEHVSKTVLKRQDVAGYFRQGQKLLVMDRRRPYLVVATVDLWEALREWDAYTTQLEERIETMEDEDIAGRYGDRAEAERRPIREVAPDIIAALQERMPE